MTDLIDRLENGTLNISGDVAEINKMVALQREAAAEIKRVQGRADEFEGALLALLSNIEGLIEESDGVTGLHLNGDVAPWDELLDGGRFEEWMPLNGFRSLLSGAGE